CEGRDVGWALEKSLRATSRAVPRGPAGTSPGNPPAVGGSRSPRESARTRGAISVLNPRVRGVRFLVTSQAPSLLHLGNFEPVRAKVRSVVGALEKAAE